MDNTGQSYPQWAGSLTVRGDLAAGAASRLGATPLEALVVGHSASRGAVCWERDGDVARQIVQRCGRHPHPQSVARARRAVTARGLIASKRYFAGQRPPGARWRLSSGTCAKTVDFRRLGVKDPLPRAELRRLRRRVEALSIESLRSDMLSGSEGGRRTVPASDCSVGLHRGAPCRRPKDDYSSLLSEFELMAEPITSRLEMADDDETLRPSRAPP